MNIAEKISHSYHKSTQKDSARRHHAKHSIGVKDLLTRFGFVGIQLLAAGFLAACNSNETVGGSGGHVDTGSTHQGYYCEMNSNYSAYIGACEWKVVTGGDCPDDLKENHLASQDRYWRLQSREELNGEKHRQCVDVPN